MIQFRNFLIVILLLYTPVVSGQWTKLNSGTTSELYKVRFINTDTGYCVGGNKPSQLAGNGIVLKTIDGGANWSKVYEDSITVFTEVACNNNLISITGRNKYGSDIMVQSGDGGATWNSGKVAFAATQLQYFDNKLHFIDAMNLELVYENSGNTQKLADRVIFYTQNSAGDLYTLSYSSVQGYNFKIGASADKGATWDTSLVNFKYITTNSLTGASLWAFGDTLVFMATYPAAIAYSYDRGTSWTDAIVQFPTSAGFVASPYRITGASSLKKIMKSIDGGLNGVVQDSTIDIVNDFYFVNEKNGYLCGRNGIIYKTTNGGGTNGVSSVKNAGTGIKIYPNPAGQFINITSTARLDGATLTIYDMTGRLLLSKKDLYGNSVQLDIGRLGTGIYPYTLTQDASMLKSGKILVNYK